MVPTIEVLFTPAEFQALVGKDLAETDCVVIDVLRATSSMMTALAHGAEAILPVAEIAEALQWRATDPSILLAGERDGLRITAEISGGPGFDLGNSPREFTEEAVRGRTIAITTTNGTRALRSCARARSVVIAAFLNLTATVRHMRGWQSQHVLVICGGTYEEAAYEDVLCAGAIVDLLAEEGDWEAADSALFSRILYQKEKSDLLAGLSRARNGRRLLQRPELKDDVRYCAEIDRVDIVPGMSADGSVIRVLNGK